jgi:hypothetical protein
MPSTTLTATYVLPEGASTTFVGTTGQLLPGSGGPTTIVVASTTNFTSTGELYIGSSNGVQIVSYTGISGSSFTGCSGGTGELYFNPTAPNVTSPLNQVTNNLTLNVTNATGFNSSGILLINGATYVTYQGTTSTSFTNVTGGSGIVSIGQSVVSYSTGNIIDLSSSILEDQYQPVQSISGTAYDNALTVFYKMRGYYAAGTEYEIYIAEGAPSSIPPSGHTLTNVTIMASWIDDKIMVQDANIEPE